MDLQKLKQLAPWKRRRLRLGRRGAYKSRPKYDPESLASWLRKYQVHSEPELRRLCQKTDEAPTPYSAMQVLNTSWQGVMDFTWGTEPPGLGTSNRNPTHEELIRLALRYQVTNRKRWDELRSTAPETFPSRYRIEDLFGSVPNFFAIVDDYSSAQHFRRYRSLVAQNGGRPPTERECRAHGINPTALRKMMPMRDLKDIFSVVSHRR